MKKQNNFLQGTTIAFTFLTMLLFVAGCKGGTEKQTHPMQQAKPKPPKMDIHTAVISGNMEVVTQHIAAGSNLNEKEAMGGSSPLISACLFGKTDIAKALIDAGADINLQNNDGSTALHTAAFFCRPHIVKILLVKRADQSVKNRYGQTAYEIVTGSFASVKDVYESLGKMLAPMGLKFDYAYIEKTRPQIAAMLR